MCQNFFNHSVLFTLVIASLLAGCATKTQQTTPPATQPHTESITELLNKANASTLPKSAHIRMQVAEKLIPTSPQRAVKTLAPIPYDRLSPPDQERLALLNARIADLTHLNNAVFFWLDRIAIYNSNNKNVQTEAHLLRAKAYNRLNEYAAALDEWASCPNLSPLKHQPKLQDDLWKTLLNTPKHRLVTLSLQSSNKEFRGWLELATLYHPGKTLRKQLDDLNTWQNTWKGHPANTYLSDDFDQLQRADDKVPQKIALLLPTSGSLARAGRAIRDGFLAAYYQSQRKQDQTSPELELFILNTNGRNMTELALEAQNLGVELIIGPLKKENVRLLRKNRPYDIPILALNSVNEEAESQTADNGTTGTLTPNFYQFGLASEDEAVSVARKAHLDGHSRALIIRPDTSWGKRTSHSFSREWLALGGDIAEEVTFDDNTQFSILSGSVLLVSASQNRVRNMSRLLGEPLGFEPRRRQDIDMLFMPSNPAQARQLKPALAYQYSGTMPVYSTSSSYSGRLQAVKDSDLNGLRVPVMPWHLPHSDSPLKRTIIDTWPSAKDHYGSFYAMGADAFQLYPRLKQLEGLPGSRLQSLTGWLSLDKNNRISRELTWQMFRNGRITPLPAKMHNNVLATQSKKQ